MDGDEQNRIGGIQGKRKNKNRSRSKHQTKRSCLLLPKKQTQRQSNSFFIIYTENNAKFQNITISRICGTNKSSERCGITSTTTTDRRDNGRSHGPRGPPRPRGRTNGKNIGGTGGGEQQWGLSQLLLGDCTPLHGKVEGQGHDDEDKTGRQRERENVTEGARPAMEVASFKCLIQFTC